jgi:vacuolar-type H+-ATPase subunit H
MTEAIEETIRALTEFEAELEKLKTGAVETKKAMIKNAGAWAETAKAVAIGQAQQVANQRLSTARTEAEEEIESIRSASQKSLKDLTESIADHKQEAVQLVVKRLLGGGT